MWLPNYSCATCPNGKGVSVWKRVHIPAAAACFENVNGYFAKSVSLGERTRSGSDGEHRDGGTCRRHGTATGQRRRSPWHRRSNRRGRRVRLDRGERRAVRRQRLKLPQAAEVGSFPPSHGRSFSACMGVTRFLGCHAAFSCLIQLQWSLRRAAELEFDGRMFAAVDLSLLGQEEGINMCKYLQYQIKSAWQQIIIDGLDVVIYNTSTFSLGCTQNLDKLGICLLLWRFRWLTAVAERVHNAYLTYCTLWDKCVCDLKEHLIYCLMLYKQNCFLEFQTCLTAIAVWGGCFCLENCCSVECGREMHVSLTESDSNIVCKHT